MKNKTNKRVVYLSIDKTLYEQIKQHSKTENRSMNNYIETVLKKYAYISQLHKIDVEQIDKDVEYINPNQLKLEF